MSNKTDKLFSTVDELSRILSEKSGLILSSNAVSLKYVPQGKERVGIFTVTFEFVKECKEQSNV